MPDLYIDAVHADNFLSLMLGEVTKGGKIEITINRIETENVAH